MSAISSIRPSTVVIASVGAITTAILGISQLSYILQYLTPIWSYRAFSLSYLLRPSTAYAVYFDHKRRTDPEFRKALKRESRKEARAAKEEAEAHGRLFLCRSFLPSTSVWVDRVDSPSKKCSPETQC